MPPIDNIKELQFFESFWKISARLAFNPQDGRDLEILIMASGEVPNEATKSPATHSQDDFEKQDYFICPHLLNPFIGFVEIS